MHLGEDGKMNKGEEMRIKIKKANQSFYDKHAIEYDKEQMAVFNKKNQARIDKIIRFLSQKTNGIHFLDVCCGTGNVMKIAKRHFKKVYGIDLSLNMLYKTNDLSFIGGDAYHLPFHDNTFDCVCYYSALHHVYDPHVMLWEAYRILKRGGYLYTDHDPNFYLHHYKMNKFVKLITPLRYIKNTKPEPLDYDLVEYHRRSTEGLDPFFIKSQLEKNGF